MQQSKISRAQQVCLGVISSSTPSRLVQGRGTNLCTAATLMADRSLLQHFKILPQVNPRLVQSGCCEDAGVLKSRIFGTNRVNNS